MCLIQFNDYTNLIYKLERNNQLQKVFFYKNKVEDVIQAIEEYCLYNYLKNVKEALQRLILQLFKCELKHI
jgi:hypothetical protein